jgi:hypothetical protein
MGQQTFVVDATHDADEPVHRGVQALWREQNAAFRARALAQLRTTRQRQHEEPQPRSA